MQVTIDPGSGFCFGVKRAIEQAESLLEEGRGLYCLGDIVHNTAEMERLRERGLTSVSREEIGRLKWSSVLFRAHGEPPSSYRLIRDKELTLTDATCPIVLKLQERIKKAWERQKGEGGQVVIFGNPGHPEITGLLGRTNGQAIIVSGPGDLSAIDPAKPVELFSQTTKDTDQFLQIEKIIRQMMSDHFTTGAVPLKVHNTICQQISGRRPQIREFAGQHDVIVFVGGAQSSNAKVLFGHCREVNPRSRFVTGPGELEAEWFEGARSAGVCGATSTPLWLMEKVAEKIREMAGEQ